MEWQHLRKIKGQNVQSFTKEFRKQALNLIIPLDSLEIVTKYIGSLHSYIRHSLLLFEPVTIDEASVKAMHLVSRGMHEQNDHPKRAATTKRRGENPSYTHCEKDRHEKRITGTCTLS